MTKKQKVIAIIAFVLIIVLIALICVSLQSKNNADSKDPKASESPVTSAEPTPEPTPTPLQFTAAPEGYFNDALFIGDSRMVGIDMMQTIDGATFFTTVGMSLTGAMSTSADVAGVGTTTLPALLQSRQFGKIYVMLGINDIGGSVEALKQTYSNLVDKLRAAQPDAIIYIMSNLHVSATQDSRGTAVNNANLNNLNDYTKTLADGETIFYLECNELFDDANGTLSADITSDGIHPDGSAYRKWGEWIMQKAIVK